MLKKILIVIVVLIVVLLGVIAIQPSTFAVTRSTTIAAAPATVFPMVNDFHQWPNWSPWEGLDPAMSRTYGGPASGTGAEYSWKGNKQVGEGKMTILDSKPNELVKIDLEFLKPFQASSETDFTFAGEGNKTTVTWTMTGKNDFMAKAFHLVMNMDKMVGGDFEKGLANLKAKSEAAQATMPAAVAGSAGTASMTSASASPVPSATPEAKPTPAAKKAPAAKPAPGKKTK